MGQCCHPCQMMGGLSSLPEEQIKQSQGACAADDGPTDPIFKFVFGMHQKQQVQSQMDHQKDIEATPSYIYTR